MQDRPISADGRDHDGGEALVRGWCPDAWRPMMAGDGLLVRVRPPFARMSRDQALGLCEAAVRFGNGAIDLTNRAGLQIRGVKEADLPTLLERLVALHLVAEDPVAEARPAILVAPDWTPGDLTERMARGLAARLGELPDLPGKLGFAIDLSGAPILTGAPADFRLERGRGGGLIVRADGRALGAPVAEDDAVDRLLDLARWFAASGGREAGRMVRHKAELPPALIGSEPPAAPRTADMQGYGVPFGRMEARDLAMLLIAGSAKAVHITPWRHILLEGVAPAPAQGFTLDPLDPVMRAHACVGAPACPQALAETRALALRLAPHVAGSFHISGCAKGCACPAPAAITLTARRTGFDLAYDARAGDPAAHQHLTPDQIALLLGAS